MILKTKLFGTVYAFASVKEVMAKANEEKSGDHLAEIAAADARERVAAKVVLANLTLHDLRENQAILKKPSIAETLDWVAALEALGISDLTREAMDQTKGFVLKNSEDLEALSGGGRCGEGGHCGHCHSEAAPEAPDDTDKIARAQDRPALKVPRTL